MKNETPEKQLTSKIKSVNNILVTVSRSPSVDQLTSALGLSLALNKMGKRSVAVFSGKIPPAINFLQPEKTFESNADSLRDFIISLSKDKADRLQVVPEGDFVRVYITPYRTRITPSDLKFSDGKFNIELIIAIGVTNRDELDGSIASHGKIFHDAITATLNLGQIHDALGMISWQDGRYGCYAEMCNQLIGGLNDDGKSLMDSSIATALLTGVVSATDQFRNSVTSPAIMNLSASLMAAGANQQLITSELESNDDDNGERKTYETNKRANGNAYSGTDFQHDDETDNTVYDRIKDPITRRLQEDRDAVGRQHGLDALREAQGDLLAEAGTISGETKPEATVNNDSTEPSPSTQHDNNVPLAPEAPTVANYQQPVPTEQVVTAAPLPKSTMNRAEQLPQIQPANGRAQYLEDPMSQVNGLATADDGASMQRDSGSYIIGNGESNSQSTMQPQSAAAPNAMGGSPIAPGEVLPPLSPLQPLPASQPSTPATTTPSLSQPLPLPPLPPAPTMPATDNINSMPPLPPAPQPTSNSMMTPASAAGTPMPPLPEPTKPIAGPAFTQPGQTTAQAASQPAPYDPGQFVIPS